MEKFAKLGFSFCWISRKTIERCLCFSPKNKNFLGKQKKTYMFKKKKTNKMNKNWMFSLKIIEVLHWRSLKFHFFMWQNMVLNKFMVFILIVLVSISYGKQNGKHLFWIKNYKKEKKVKFFWQFTFFVGLLPPFLFLFFLHIQCLFGVFANKNSYFDSTHGVIILELHIIISKE